MSIANHSLSCYLESLFGASSTRLKPRESLQICRAKLKRIQHCLLKRNFPSSSTSLQVTPFGTISVGRAVEFINKLRNTNSVYLGRGVHFFQEDHLHRIGREIAKWLPSTAEEQRGVLGRSERGEGLDYHITPHSHPYGLTSLCGHSDENLYH